MEFKFKTCFSSTVKPLVTEERDKYLSLASISNLSSFIPNIDTARNIDLLPAAFNACVINRVNLNGDIVDTATAMDMADYFINKPIDVEHNRQHLIGVILTVGFSKFGTDEPLSRAEASQMTTPFNLTLGCVFWKVVNPELTDRIEESNDPSSPYYLTVSASWELGFSEFDVAVASAGGKNLEDCAIVSDAKSISVIEKYLKCNGGTGKLQDGKLIYRKVVGQVVPLGVGITGNPAADVVGIAVNTATPSKDITICDSAESHGHSIDKCSCGKIIRQCRCSFAGKPVNVIENGCKDCQESSKKISQSSNLVVNTDSKKLMKLNSLSDINETNWKELTASVVTEFVAQEMKKANEQFIADKNKDAENLKASQAAQKQLEADHATMKASLELVQTELGTLKTEKTEREKVDKFNHRMSDIHASYTLSDDVSKVIASQIKDLGTADEAFAKYKESMAVFLTPFKKKTEAEIAAEAKASADAKIALEAKATADAATAEAKKLSEAQAQKVIDDAIEKGKKDKGGLPNTAAGQKPTLIEKYAVAFSLEEGFEFRNTSRR